MPYSMTGVGRASGVLKQPAIKIDIEIRSYNHRFLEISVKGPNALSPFEDEIRKLIQASVSRGHVIVVVMQDREIFPAKVDIDQSSLDAYLNLAAEMKKKHEITGDIDVNTLLSIPGLVRFSQTQVDAKAIFNELKPILEKTLESFLQMKKKEGENIAKEIRKSIDNIEDGINDVEKLIPKRNEQYKKHLSSLVKDFKDNLNEDRFYQELLYNVDRTDVTEECKRLYSHINLFRDALDNDNHPGRRLNFLLQEMQREANTLSVKANYLEITKEVIQIKEEIEKIREQVQNIE